MKKITRLDIFANIDEYIKFMEWAATKNPKTKADMVKLLHAYKKADLVVNEHPELVEHKIYQSMKVARIIPPKKKESL